MTHQTRCCLISIINDSTSLIISAQVPAHCPGVSEHRPGVQLPAVLTIDGQLLVSVGKSHLEQQQ